MGATSAKEASARVGLDCCISRDLSAQEAEKSKHPAPSVRSVSSQCEQDELQDEYRVAAERERILGLVEEEDGEVRGRKQRFYSCSEVEEIEEFLNLFSRQPDLLKRDNSLLTIGCGPWGVSSEKGNGEKNAWGDVDCTKYAVRGPTYLWNRHKLNSLGSLAELCVVDLFISGIDIPSASTHAGAKTVQRLRRAGEKRRLFVLNFRLVPLHLVVVWALPNTAGGGDSPAAALLERFFGEMSDEERSKRLKVIPKILVGPWVVRRLVGENHPAILGRQIPVDYYTAEGVLEASVGVASSSAAQRVAKTMLRAGSALALELVLLVEGQTEAELPEQALGGFSIYHADLTQLREVGAG
mmetsp:Transcript_65006/g.188485  ORF Transcript_65006/g.188485 Transcript_65006/m.188485 type:complete len:355 (-) Transcript_65006:137-1201(-)